MTELPTLLIVLVAVLMTLAVAGVAFGLTRRAAARRDLGMAAVIGGGFLWFLAGVIITTTTTTVAVGVFMMLVGVAVIVYGTVVSRMPDDDQHADPEDEDEPAWPAQPSWGEGSPYLRFPAAFHRRRNRRG